MAAIKARLRKAVRLAARPESTFLELARSLASLHDTDPAALRRFITDSGMKQRKAYYLLELGRRLQGLRLSEARLKRIGWTKLSVIGKTLTRENAETRLQWAEENSSRKLADLVRGAKSTSKLHCVQLYFSPREYRRLEEGILGHGGQRRGRGLIDKEKAILEMVERGLAARKSTSTRPKARTSRKAR
jgi:hypothetical protein